MRFLDGPLRRCICRLPLFSHRAYFRSLSQGLIMTHSCPGVNTRSPLGVSPKLLIWLFTCDLEGPLENYGAFVTNAAVEGSCEVLHPPPSASINCTLSVICCILRVTIVC